MQWITCHVKSATFGERFKMSVNGNELHHISTEIAASFYLAQQPLRRDAGNQTSGLYSHRRRQVALHFGFKKRILLPM